MRTLLFVLMLLGVVALDGASQASAQEYVKLEVRGTLFKTKEGGLLVRTKTLAFELDLGGNAKLTAEAKKLEGKSVLLRGELTTRELGKGKALATFIRVSALQEAK